MQRAWRLRVEPNDYRWNGQLNTFPYPALAFVSPESVEQRAVDLFRREPGLEAVQVEFLRRPLCRITRGDFEAVVDGEPATFLYERCILPAYQRLTPEERALPAPRSRVTRALLAYLETARPDLAVSDLTMAARIAEIFGRP